MSMVYDLLLNFQDEVLEFFEWEKEDDLEHIKKIPMLKIESSKFLEMLENKFQVNEDFLLTIYRLTEKFDLEKIDYACLFTDGRMVLAVEFDKMGRSIFKSRLLLEDEEEILRYAKTEVEEEISYQVLEKEGSRGMFTRKEKRIENFLKQEILCSYEKKEISKICYLYLEYFEVEEEDFVKAKNSLLESMMDGINKKHLELYDLLVLADRKNVL